MARSGEVNVVFRCHLLVYPIELKTGVSVIVGLGEGPRSILSTISVQNPVTKQCGIKRTTLD